MARKWETIISYEDRAEHLTTTRWRLSGVKTKEGALNTDDGVAWLSTELSGDTVTATLYKDAAMTASVATGTADVSGCDNTGANAAQVVLTAANDSGLSGSFWIHHYEDDGSCPVNICLCVDEDLDTIWASVDDSNAIPGYDSTYGCAEYIRFAQDDVIGRVTVLYRDELGGHGAPEAWYITDANRVYPDLRRIANPAQLRSACAYRALAIALGSYHERRDDTMYSEQRDYFDAQYEQALAAVVLTVKTGSGDNAEASASISTQHMSRA